MSVDKTPTGVVYTVTNGAAGQQYPLTFPYINGADVKAYYVLNGAQTVLTYGVHYAVASQTFIASVALPLGAKLAIYRQTDLTQEILWKDGQAVYTPDIMKADDKLTLIAQEIAADMSRTVKLTREEEAAGGKPEDVVASIYSSRDAAAASATAAEGSAQAASGKADEATASATAAAASAAAAAGAVPDNLVARVTAVESKNASQDTRLDAVEAGKANLDMDNLTPTGSGKVANYAKPSQRAIAMTFPAYGQWTAEAPASGWIKLVAVATASAQGLRGSRNAYVFDHIMWSSGANQTLVIEVPVRKGDKVFVDGNISNGLAAQFTYDEGAF